MPIRQGHIRQQEGEHGEGKTSLVFLIKRQMQNGLNQVECQKATRHQIKPTSRQSGFNRVRSLFGNIVFSPWGGKGEQCTYLSMITGSDGVSFRFPQLFFSQHRLKG